MIRPRNETGHLLLSITKICEKLIKQTHTKPDETLELKLTKPRENFQFHPFYNFGLDSKWMSGSINLELYHPLFITAEENNKFEFYLFPESKLGGNSYEKVRDENEKDLEISINTAANLQDELKFRFLWKIIEKKYQKE